MNNFYSIAEEGNNPESNFQLKNIGNTIIFAMTGYRDSPTRKYERNVTEDDYDNQFINKISTTKPPYEIPNLIEYHFNFYKKTQRDQETFIKHMKYVVLPKLKNKDIYYEIVNEWIKEKEASLFPNKTSEVTNNFTLTGSQNVQINQNSPYSNQNFQYKSEDIKDILLLLKKDIENLSKELKEEINDDIDYALKQVSKNKDITPQLKSIGSFVSNIGTSFFVNLISSSVYDLAKGLLGI